MTSSFTSRWLLLGPWMLTLVGCLPLGVPEGIACESDEHCPFESWCGFRRTCETDLESQPSLTFDGVAPTADGPFAQAVDVNRDVETDLVLAFTNTGPVNLPSPFFEATGPECLGLFFDEQSISNFGPGDEGRIPFDVEPSSDCASPASLEVRARNGGWRTTEVFELTLVP